MKTAIHVTTARKMLAKQPRLKLLPSRSGLSMVLWYATHYARRFLAAFPLENHCIERSMFKAYLGS